MDDQLRPLTPARKRQLWALLEDLDADLGDVVADMPRGQLKSTLEDALGRLASAQWILAKQLGGRRRDEPDHEPENGHLDLDWNQLARLADFSAG